jgi:hypothetical protein
VKACTAAACTECKRIKADRCALTCTGQKLLSSILRGRARTEEKQAGWRRGAEIGDAELVRTTLATSSTTCGAWDRAHPRAWGCRGVGASPRGERNRNDGVLGDATEGRGATTAGPWRGGRAGGEARGADDGAARAVDEDTRTPWRGTGGAPVGRRRGGSRAECGVRTMTCWSLAARQSREEARGGAQERGGGGGCVRW